MPGISAERALKKLINGNERYVNGEYLEIEEELAKELEEGQLPFAAIVGCSDSRVPPEIIFDQGIGDLFVVRTAGEVVDDIALGSIEYAIKYLDVKLIVVLGHLDCGAVKAAVEGGYQPGYIAAVTDAIKPAVAKAKTEKGNLFFNSIKANVELNVARLKTSHILREAMLNDFVKIIGAIYDIRDGHVVFGVSTWYGEALYY